MSRRPLTSLAIQYFRRRGYIVDKDFGKEDNFSPKKFDFVVHRGSDVYPVWIKDWNRTVGVNVVINVDKVAQELGFSNPILIANKFSEHAKAYANRKGIKLITKTEIIRTIRLF